MQRELNVLALHKGTEHYLFLYDDQSMPSLIDLFRRYASDAELSFNWFDAAVMSEKGKTQMNLDGSDESGGNARGIRQAPSRGRHASQGSGNQSGKSSRPASASAAAVDDGSVLAPADAERYRAK